jgi:hypothetical protein
MSNARDIGGFYEGVKRKNGGISCWPTATSLLQSFTEFYHPTHKGYEDNQALT